MPPAAEPHLRTQHGNEEEAMPDSYQHQRQHHQQHEVGDQHEHEEGSPLLKASRFVRHFSMEGKQRGTEMATDFCSSAKTAAARRPISSLLGAVAAAVVVAFSVHGFATRPSRHHPPSPHVGPYPAGTVPIESAQQAMLDLGDGIEMWYQTWGNRKEGVPVLFVHGGPGNAVSDYGTINSKFFDADKFWVVESDQRGTGRSTPSVWDDWKNMKHYRDITIDVMAGDFEVLREELGIDRWLVFGGSWGSTLGLYYGERYPDRSLALILRGIFLNTRPEFDDVYTRRRFLGNEKQLREFDVFYELAAREAEDSAEAALDPDDSERIVRLYSRMIWRGERSAMWKWYVFENNLMEEDPQKLLDFDRIDPRHFPEASGVAFFESQLFLHGQFEEPFNLLGRVGNLLESKSNRNSDAEKAHEGGEGGGLGGGPEHPAVHTWICQGRRDQVCPQKYARELVDALQDAGVPTTPRFIDAPHQCTDPVMQVCLRESVDEFHRRLMEGELTTTGTNNL